MKLAALTIAEEAPHKFTAAKTVYLGEDKEVDVTSFNAGTWFYCNQHIVNGIHELSTLLTALTQDHYTFVIRDIPLPHIDLGKPIRKTGPSNVEPYFTMPKDGRPFFMIDIDGVACPDHINLLANPKEAILYIITLLPDNFQGVSFHAHLSARAGLGGGKSIRVHIWYWLSHPIPNQILKSWALQLKAEGLAIDPSMYDSVHAHFTSDPIFDGVPDPFNGNRSFFFQLDKDQVNFPEATPVKHLYTSGKWSHYPSSNFEEWLSLVGDHAGGLGFHDPLLKAALQYVREHGLATDRIALRDKFRETVLNANCSKHSPSEVQCRASDTHLFGLIDWAIATLNSDGKTSPIKGIVPYFTSSPGLTAEQASLALKSLIKKFFENPVSMGIKAAAGLGKTTETVRITCQIWMHDIQVEIYVPTHRLADEIAERLRYAASDKNKLSFQKHVPSGARVQVIRGRSFQRSTGDRMCVKHMVAEKIASLGYSVYPNLCKPLEGLGCPHYDNCHYIKQFAGGWDVRIFPHAYLSLKRTFLDEKQPALAIIDESFYANLLEHKELPVTAITNYYWSEFCKSTLIDGLKSGLPLLAYLREKLGDDAAEQIEDALSCISHQPKVVLGNDDIEEQLKHLDKFPPVRRLETVLEVLIDELHTGRHESHAIRYADGTVTLDYRKKITRLNHLPTLTIDASLDPIIHSQIFPKIAPQNYVRLEVERSCEVTQVCNTRNSKHSLLAESKSSIRVNDISAWLQDKTSMLVLGPVAIVGDAKKDKPAVLDIPAQLKVDHFGGIRGVDAYKDEQAILLISRNQPSINGLEDAARAMWYDSEEPLQLSKEWITEARGYRLRSGELVGINVVVHPDGRIQKLHEQIRECESLQAIDRLRLVHSKTTKQLYILSNLPLDITVDSLVTWKGLFSPTPIEIAWAQCAGVMPLSPRWLADKFSHLFPSIDIAKKSISKECQITINTIGNFAHLYAYRLHKQKGTPRRCLSKFDVGKTKQQLEELLGKEVVVIEVC